MGGFALPILPASRGTCRAQPPETSYPAEISGSEPFDPDNLDFYRQLVVEDTRYGLGRFAELGVVRSIDGGAATGADTTSGGWVKLDVLGKVLVHRLVAEMAGIPLPGSLEHLSPAELLVAVAKLPNDAAVAELDNWLAAGDETAMQRMIGAMAEVSPPQRLPRAAPPRSGQRHRHRHRAFHGGGSGHAGTGVRRRRASNHPQGHGARG